MYFFIIILERTVFNFSTFILFFCFLFSVPDVFVLACCHWSAGFLTSVLYAVFRQYCRAHGDTLILGAFDQFVFIYFIILLINCENQPVFSCGGFIWVLLGCSLGTGFQHRLMWGTPGVLEVPSYDLLRPNGTKLTFAGLFGTSPLVYML